MDKNGVLHKILKICALLFVLSETISANGVDRIKFVRADIEQANDLYAKDIKFSFEGMGNKFKISASYQLVREIDAGKVNMMMEILNSGDEKAQPIVMNMNVCKEYTDQSLGKWQEAEKFGNMTGCGIKKPGFYYLKDYVPDIVLSDNVKLPEGDYKTKATLKHGDDILGIIAMTFKV